MRGEWWQHLISAAPLAALFAALILPRLGACSNVLMPNG
jgi:hypothetical protein